MKPPARQLRALFALLSLLVSLLSPQAAEPDPRFTPEMAEFVKRFKGGGMLQDGSAKPTPAEALAQFQVAPGLRWDLAATEPMVRQPLNLHFDERGRLWVVQYLQYPFPAGLKVTKYDQYLRAIYDQVPPPPPNHFKGKDRITILEDTNGDGVFDKSKDFLSDLNIARSVVTGRGGVWVLNPPYLLFYPDKNRDDIPDGPPEVKLSGFGLEDTHSGANSLAWGPDGWLYGAHGSTCTADIKGVKFLGQAIWRFHPVTGDFEVFAEGGGNTFSVEFDAQGRVFSGSNYGQTRGLHYAQGALYIKGWSKHGPAMSPYRFGWFEHMAHKGYEPRFPQAMLYYEGGAIPQYEGHIVVGMALTSRVMASKVARDTSSFQTADIETSVLSSNRWFRPVDMKTGPDGAIYFADWCDSRLSHLDPRDTWDKESGRVYRLSAAGAKVGWDKIDFAKLSGDELIKLLSHANKWHRQTALRVLWDRGDKSLLPKLKELVFSKSVFSVQTPKANAAPPTKLNTESLNTEHLPLEAFWAVHASGGFDDAFALQTLAHPNEMVRYWTIRLLGDRKRVTPQQQAALLALAKSEPAAEVRAQLASSVTRLPGKDALPITRELLLRSEDVTDKHVPLLLWWAVESKCATDRDAILRMLEDSTFWHAAIVQKFIIARLGQRFTAERTDANLETAAKLFTLAPSPADADELIKGMEAGLQGDAVKSVPPALAKKVAELWASRPPTPTLISFAVRLGHAPAAQAALARITDPKVPEADRRKTITLLAERRVDAAVPTFLKLLRFEKSDALRLDLVNALQRFASPDIARELLDLYPGFPAKLRDTAQAALASRPDWSRRLLAAVDEGQLAKEQISIANLLAITAFKDTTSDALIKKHWGRLTKSSEEKEAQIAKVKKLLASGKGDAKSGHEVFKLACAVCHTLNKEGGKIGPDLTGYERDNLDFILPAIVDPSLAIREEYIAFNITTTDAATLTGLVTELTKSSVTLLDIAGNKTVLPRTGIKDMRASHTSLMPEGLLDALNEQQVRDLFAYFTASAPATTGKK
ncbi:MAG: dehydrogenase [Pedosphaera sp. Tous-C6FEB]|nr:MAG: dehydrogenase [Pedosphaera sp. Tous-C6FEB]